MTTLTSNARPLPATARYLVAARDSTGLLDDPRALRRRFAEDGFVWLRGVLDPQRVRRLRGRYFAAFDPSYLEPGTSPAEGVFSGQRPPGLPAHGTPGHPAYEMVRSPEFAEFASDPALAAVAAALLGRRGVLLERQILRHFDRSQPAASRAHSDVAYLDEGSDHLVTVWVPLGDCPRATGGLMYIAGSHRFGADRLAALRQVTDRPDDDRALSHDLAWVSDQLGQPWSWADYSAGDITVHSPYTVHASLDTVTDTMRASVDLRFVAEGEPIDPRWRVPWSGDDGN